MTPTEIEAWERRTARDVADLISRYLQEHPPPTATAVSEQLEAAAASLSRAARQDAGGE